MFSLLKTITMACARTALSNLSMCRGSQESSDADLPCRDFECTVLVHMHTHILLNLILIKKKT